jgi:hypothetical protein
VRNGYSATLQNSLATLRTDGYDPEPLEPVDAQSNPEAIQILYVGAASSDPITHLGGIQGHLPGTAVTIGLGNDPAVEGLSDTILIGAMEAPDQEGPGYFCLTILAAPAPQRTATAALTHTTKSTTPEQH